MSLLVDDDGQCFCSERFKSYNNIDEFADFKKTGKDRKSLETADEMMKADDDTC